MHQITSSVLILFSFLSFSHSKFFIFDWPVHLQSSIPPPNATLLEVIKREGYTHDQGGNFGNGRLLDEQHSIYQSSIFQFYHFSLSKLRIHPKRTLVYSEADFYVMPYDIGFSTAFSKKNGEFWRKPWISCPESNEIIPLLKEEIKKTNQFGHNILIFNSFYDYLLGNCRDIIDVCLNCTILGFDLEDYKENKLYNVIKSNGRQHFSLNRRVYSVPYPSSRRWDERQLSSSTPFTAVSSPLSSELLSQFSPTIQEKYNRPILASFWGSKKVWYQPSTTIRNFTITTCNRHSEHCLYVPTLTRLQGRTSRNLTSLTIYSNSVFCLHPPGDGESRKGIFDSFAFGCIPVLFTHGLLHKTFPWYFTKELEEQTTVYLSYSLLVKKKINLITDVLLKIPLKVIQEKQQTIESIAKSLQYAVPPARMKDYIGFGGAPSELDGQGQWKPPFYDAMDRIVDSMTNISQIYKQTGIISEDEAPNKVGRWDYMWIDKPLRRNSHPIVIH